MPMSSEAPSLAATVIERCKAYGFALAGIASAEPTRYERELRDWLSQGKHGEMSYLTRHVDCLLDPRKLLDGARSVICVADRYHDGSADAGREPMSGRIARYARGEDYHKVIKRRLHVLCDSLRRDFPQEKFRACVDTAPLLEREYAQRAGLGSVGKHTLLIGKPTGMGSYLLLGAIVTTLDVPRSEAGEDDPCGTCTRCIDACPTNAITPWSVDARKCISYLTIEHRGAIDGERQSQMNDWIFGCDVCQEVCPHNQPTKRALAQPTHTAYAPRRDAFDLLDVLGWTELDRQTHFTRSAMKRAKLNMMKRNALVAAGNTASNLERAKIDELTARLQSILSDGDEDDLVRKTAREVLARISA